MDILGHEIDLHFVYQISPVIIVRNCQIHFVLSFKDGKTHVVKYREDYSKHGNCREQSTPKHGFRYNGNDLRKLDKAIKEDTKKLNKLRSEIIYKKNNPTK